MSHKQRVLFPFLALLFTVISSMPFLLYLATIMVSRLQRQAAPNPLLPAWLHFCLVNLFLLKLLAVIGLGCAVLGAALTLFLVLRTEPPEAAYRHLAGIGGIVLIPTASVALLLFILIMATGGTKNVPDMPLILGVSAVGMGILFFLFIAISFCFVEICGRLKERPSVPPPHVLQ